MEDFKIKSICPADGVTAIFSNLDGTDTAYEVPVVFWGIIEKPTGDEIHGFIAGEMVENIDDMPGFICYETA